ncbi:hypothetical protein SPI_07875 [Niveomyces insectorum RCEF 264]|uniref:Uncharacterized protein n=1 Tax=Niveomyces insectorum RCEF 264 TaxID=1081102 RepID=A0A167P400_9HYPO|nr:hypothetical protein SPI_07875 [Niveomyces insectorum RCEF 264]
MTVGGRPVGRPGLGKDLPVLRLLQRRIQGTDAVDRHAPVEHGRFMVQQLARSKTVGRPKMLYEGVVELEPERPHVRLGCEDPSRLAMPHSLLATSTVSCAPLNARDSDCVSVSMVISWCTTCSTNRGR